MIVAAPIGGVDPFPDSHNTVVDVQNRDLGVLGNGGSRTAGVAVEGGDADEKDDEMDRQSAEPGEGDERTGDGGRGRGGAEQRGGGPRGGRAEQRENGSDGSEIGGDATTDAARAAAASEVVKLEKMCVKKASHDDAARVFRNCIDAPDVNTGVVSKFDHKSVSDESRICVTFFLK